LWEWAKQEKSQKKGLKTVKTNVFFGFVDGAPTRRHLDHEKARELLRT